MDSNLKIGLNRVLGLHIRFIVQIKENQDGKEEFLSFIHQYLSFLWI